MSPGAADDGVVRDNEVDVIGGELRCPLEMGQQKKEPEKKKGYGDGGVHVYGTIGNIGDD